MPTFHYDLAEMGEFIELLDRSIDEAVSHLESARSTAAAVLEHYSGSAATAFTESHDHWQELAGQHVTALREYRTYVATARDNYAAALRTNLEMFG